MHVHVDARLLHGGGIGRYVRELTSRWLLRADVGRICFLGRPGELTPFLARHDRRGVGAVVPWTDPPYSAIAQARWPRLARACGDDPNVTFFPHYDVPLVRHPSPSVVTVHDLIQFELPAGFPWWKRVLGRRLLGGALARAGAVVTVSETSRHAICRNAPAMCNKVHVVRNGIGEAFRPLGPGEIRAAHEEWGHLRPFVLCVGPAKAHKNLEHAVRVLAELPEQEDWRLVLVGPTAAERDRLVRAAGRPDVGPRVVVEAHVTDDRLRALYSMSNVVLVPSLLEGFGLPVLEARACGADVLAGDLAWSRELTASGVRLVPGWSPSVWAREVREARRAGPSADDASWSWSSAAEQTFEILRGVTEVGDTSRSA